MVAFYDLIIAQFTINFVQLIQMLMSLPKLLNDKFLERNDIYDVQKRFDLIQHHYAELVGYTAEAVLSHDCEDRFDDLSSEPIANVVRLIYRLIHSACKISIWISQKSLCSSKGTESGMHQHQNIVYEFQRP